MIRWRKVQTVASFEFLSTVKRIGFLVATFGMPVFLLLYGLIASIPGYLGAQKEASEVRVLGVVDGAGVLDLEQEVEVSLVDLPEEARVAIDLAGQRAGDLLRQGNVIFTPFATEDAAHAALRAADQEAENALRGYYVLPEDYLATGAVRVVRRDGGVQSAGTGGEQFRRLLEEALLEEYVPSEIAPRMKQIVATREDLVLQEDGSLEPFNIAATIARFAIPGVMALLLFISLMMTNGFLLQATATEKENRVVEVILSSANPDELLFGKLLGLGAAGLLQLGVWCSMIIVGGLVLAGVLTAVGVQIPWGMMAIGVPYFLLTYLFLGSLILATGSLGSNLKESQQWSVIWSLLPVAPLMFLGLLIPDPHGTVARVLSWIPFTSALTVMVRMVLEPGGVAWWEVVGGMVVLLLSIYVAIRLGARLFRVGLLLGGSKVKLREVLQQARLGH